MSNAREPQIWVFSNLGTLKLEETVWTVEPAGASRGFVEGPLCAWPCCGSLPALKEVIPLPVLKKREEPKTHLDHQCSFHSYDGSTCRSSKVTRLPVSGCGNASRAQHRSGPGM